MTTDYMTRVTAANGQIRGFAITTAGLVEEARKAHNTSPVATAALGRLLTAGAMMGCMMKGEKDLLTLQIRGDGPIKGLTVTADSQGNVKGYAIQPAVVIPANAIGKLDVAGAIGNGNLTVIKDLGMKEPYSGQVELQTGEIAEDITYYFAVSEQVPSAVGLGVLMSKENVVKQAGGFIIQLMPGADDEIIAKLEANISKIKSVTQFLEEGYTPEMILKDIIGDMEMNEPTNTPVQFSCNCTKQRVEKVLISLGTTQLKELIDEGEEVEVKCHFCNHGYKFSVEELRKLRASSKRK